MVIIHTMSGYKQKLYFANKKILITVFETIKYFGLRISMIKAFKVNFIDSLYVLPCRVICMATLFTAFY